MKQYTVETVIEWRGQIISEVLYIDAKDAKEAREEATAKCLNNLLVYTQEIEEVEE